ncbi:hypothetical protein AB0A74_19855 [Saccharothrix sp. NPDC042600]|uniref:hypothetical protein n=1 Tax=Saccharothrix TaxID=2071 RepID=UPI0034070A3E
MQRKFLVPAAVVVAVVLAVVALTAERDVPVAALPAKPTIAGPLRLEPALPKAGQEVVVRAELAADRPLVLRGLTVRVQDTSGAAHDFPELRDQALGTTPREIRLHRVFPEPGEYTYYLAYRLDGDWVTLRPWSTVTVR